MATLAVLKKKIAALEAQVEKVTKAEIGSAVTKVRKIMADYGMTIEHLASALASTRGASKKSADSRKTGTKTAAKAKGSKPPKYRNPATGVTWAGVGRAPAWIVGAKNRDDFLIEKAAVTDNVAEAAALAKKAAKRAAPAKRAKASATAKKAARQAVASKKASPAAKRAAPTKRASAKKAAVKKVAVKASAKAAGKRAASKRAAAPAGADAQAASPASAA